MTEPRARLLCRTGPFAGATYELGSESIIGRDDNNEVVLLANTVSGRHARIFREGEAFYLEDLGSRNGTLVDGIPVTEPVRLDTLSVITVSEAYDLVFQVAASTPPASAPQPVPHTPAPPHAQTAVAGKGAGKAGSPHPDPGPAHVPDEPPPAAPPTGSHTRVDFAAFGPLPDLDPVPPDKPPAPPPGGARFYVVVSVAGQASNEVDLSQGENTLGRSEDCDVVIGHESLSRRHARLELSGDRVTLRDLGSTNGTFVDGREISEVTIAPGSSFKLGAEVEMRLEKR